MNFQKSNISFEDLAVENETPHEITTNIDLDKSTPKIEEVEEEDKNLAKFPGTTKTWIRNQDFLARVLEGKKPRERVEILKVIHDAEIEADDPLYAVLLATGALERLLRDYPDDLREVMINWQKNYRKKLKESESLLDSERKKLEKLIELQKKDLIHDAEIAVKLCKKDISASVNTLLTKAAFTKVATSLNSMILGSLAVLAVMGVGIFIGDFIANTNKPEVSSTSPRELTVDEIVALEWGTSEAGVWARKNPDLVNWAKSNEGKYARNLTSWNQTLLSGHKDNWFDFNKKKRCQKDVEKMGIVLSLEGRITRTGFCLLWVSPPDKREFVQK